MHVSSLSRIRFLSLVGGLVKEALGFHEYRCQICGGPLPSHFKTTACCATNLCHPCEHGWVMMGTNCVLCGKHKMLTAQLEAE